MRWLDHREPLPASLRGAIIALGNFDGFHLGHQAVAGEAIRWARAEGRPSIIATFDPHPVRHFKPGDSAALAQVQNAAFTGSWGFCPNTVEQIEYRSGMSNTSHQGILFLHDQDQLAGYCWTCVAPSGGKTKGIIGMIGIDPRHRGQGVSKPVLVAGMEHLLSIHVDEIGLHVDGNNTPAIRLYNSVGFEKVGELHWYEYAR